MDEEEVDFALWYLHICTGTLMYYPDLPDEWFKNHIICSPQVVFDMYQPANHLLHCAHFILKVLLSRRSEQN